MRSAVYGGVLAVLISSTASAQAAPPAKPPKMTALEATTSTVTKLEDSWASALVRRDRATFERMMAPKFIYTENDRTIERSGMTSAMFTADTALEAHNDSLDLHIFNNTVVVTGWRIVTGKNNGAPFEHRYRFSDVWMPRSGSWQVVAAHAFIDPSKK